LNIHSRSINYLRRKPTFHLWSSDSHLTDNHNALPAKIAKEHSAVIIGRCGFHVLREYPNQVSIFLHGDIAFRNSRVQKLYNVSEEVAGKMIAQSDKERAVYINTFTRKEWANATNYDISIDTGKTGVDKTVKLILHYLELAGLT
jgi:CMP/dCMP kinase